MTHETTSPSRFAGGQRHLASKASSGRRFLLIAVALSVAVHLAAGLLVVLLPRALPREAPPQAQGSVELLMVEQKGSQPNQASPRKAAPPVSTPEPDAEPVPAQAEPGKPVPEPSNAPASGTAAQQAPQPAHEKEAKVQASQQQNAPVFNLGGTDSESNAIVLGDQVVPAMMDDRFRNRPPPYPSEAEMNGEHGTVVIVIHVSGSGTAAGADVAESSGYEVLDQAALAAVLKWHFRPAIKDGQGVPFDMPFRFVFEPD